MYVYIYIIMICMYVYIYIYLLFTSNLPKFCGPGPREVWGQTGHVYRVKFTHFLAFIHLIITNHNHISCVHKYTYVYYIYIYTIRAYSLGKKHISMIITYDWWFHHLWKIWKSMEMMTFPTEWKNKSHVPVTTNQRTHTKHIHIYPNIPQIPMIIP